MARIRLVAVLLVVALVALGRPAVAQTVGGNMFAGAGTFACCGSNTGAWQMGTALSLPVTPQFSIDGEFGLIGLSGTGTYDHAWYGFLGALNGTYHFKVHDRYSPRPFLTGGLGEAFGHNDGAGGVNVGGGVDLWMRDRRGVRLEVRDQLFAAGGYPQLLTVRVGLIFR